MNEVSTLIAILGFPIACCIGMFYMWNAERESHKEEMRLITEAITNNTVALTTLIEKLDNIEVKR